MCVVTPCYCNIVHRYIDNILMYDLFWLVCTSTSCHGDGIEENVVLIFSSYSSSIVRNLIAFLYSCLAALIHHVLASINDGVTPLPPAIAQQNPIHYIVWILLPQIRVVL